jgi:hypothetical protein
MLGFDKEVPESPFWIDLQTSAFLFIHLGKLSFPSDSSNLSRLFPEYEKEQ